MIKKITEKLKKNTAKKIKTEKFKKVTAKKIKTEMLKKITASFSNFFELI